MKLQSESPPTARRMQHVRRSSVREMMKQMGRGDIISFAAGLPDPALYPVGDIAAAATKVMCASGAEALQYTTTEGYHPLRTYVAEHILKKEGLDATADNVLITNGSQQALDLIGKVFLDQGDTVLMESPGYMSAIQAFEMYQPAFLSCPFGEEGVDPDQLDQMLCAQHVKLMYAVPTFQNPTGLSYSKRTRERVATCLDKHNTLLVEDMPYSELRYEGDALPTLCKLRRGNTILVGSFSKVLSPGMRMGWIATAPKLIEQLGTAKQASDLCSNYLTQRILYQYLCDNDLDAHVQRLVEGYRVRRDIMQDCLETHFSGKATWTRPHGGMFVWMTLPEGFSSTVLLEEALRDGVIFAPGSSFYANEAQENTLRLNFTHATPARMNAGVAILAAAFARLVAC